MTKSVIKAISTKHRPCSDTMYYEKESCIEDKATKKFKENVGCILPWMKQLQPNTPFCGIEDESYKNGLQEYLCAMNQITNNLYNKTEFGHICTKYGNLKNDCNYVRSCHEHILEKQYKSHDYFDGNTSELDLFWSNPKIVYVEDFVSYDLHNFIGEVGGFLGLFLGFSFTSLFGVFDMIQQKIGTQTQF